MNYFFMAQSFSNQVLIMLKNLAKNLLDRQPSRVHAMAVTPVSSHHRENRLAFYLEFSLFVDWKMCQNHVVSEILYFLILKDPRYKI